MPAEEGKSATYINIYGRKPGRGVRPWLLIPKILAVGVVLGASAALEAIALPIASATNPGHNVLGLRADMANTLFHWLIEPAVVVAIALGLLLFLQHPREFARARWWQVKMGCLLLSGLLARSIAPLLAESQLRDPAKVGLDLWQVLCLRNGALITVTICIIVLGRLKPRLGQRPRRLAEPRPPQKETP